MIGIGLDAVDIERLRAVLERRPRLGGRVFTEGEQAACRDRSDPVPGLAARFAAKEAVMKALGVGLGAFPLRDVEVVREPGGRPRLVLHGAAARLASTREVAGWHVSLTHTAVTACAVAVAMGPA